MLTTERNLNMNTKITLLTQLITKEKFKLKELNVFKKEKHYLN